MRTERPSSSPALTRRQFLAWSAALGGAAALPAARWLGDGRVRLGLVGLGTRGTTALEACAGAAGVDVVALCDRHAGLVEKTARAHAATWLATNAEPLFHRADADAWVIAAAAADQLRLAAAACAAGRDVLLVPPVCFEPAGLEALAAAASRSRRRVHLARATSFALDAGQAAGVLGADADTLSGAEVVAELAAEHEDDEPTLINLIDEVDFARELLGGRVVRTLRVAAPRRRPGSARETRVQLRLLDGDGRRRQLTIAAHVRAGATAEKRSRVVLEGARGSVALAGMPLAAPAPEDLALFLAAVRRRDDGAALSLPRLLEVVAHLR